MSPARGTALAACLIAAPMAFAQDFSAGSEAKSWNLFGEEPARFEAEVVDVLCEISGDCAENCGDGVRQLGLLRGADGVLVLAMKNGQPAFSGAVADLLPYCGKIVTVDGLLVGETDVTAAKYYMVQTIQPADGTPHKADRFTQAWAEAHPQVAKDTRPWFRRDPDITAFIEAEGYLGLGAEADAAFIADWF